MKIKTMSKKEPLVSVITVVYNGDEYIEECIQSVIGQDYDNIEYIIIDGGSTDGTVEIIRKYADMLADWVSEPDDGVYDAMNKGIERATGNVIGLLNADDFYADGAIQTVAETHTEHPNSIIVGAMNRVKADGSSYTLRRNLNHRYLDGTIRYAMPVNHPATFVPETVYRKLGTFDARFQISGDYDFICRCYTQEVPFVFVDQVLSNMRAGGLSSGLNNVWKKAREHYVMRRKNQMVDPVTNAALSAAWFVSTVVKRGGKTLLPESLEAYLYRLRHGGAAGKAAS
jgi:glycosyltransferase involved in cell wall biosynthesis